MKDTNDDDMMRYTQQKAGRTDYAEPDDGSELDFNDNVNVDPEHLDDAPFSVSKEELSNKEGNYVFTVGNVGCGKSTLQNLLIARLWKLHNVNLEYASVTGDWRHDKLLNDWVVAIKHGHLPERTQQGRLQEFNIAISQPKRQKLTLNFLEISGEDIKSIVPTLDLSHRPKINSHLVEYLRTSKDKMNKRFIFVSDCEDNKRTSMEAEADKPEFTEDILFRALLHYLLGADGLRMERINVLFVAAKWDTVETEYKSVARYFNKNFPNSRAILSSDRCRAQYMPFSVGKIQDVQVVNKRTGERYFEKRITSLEHRYVDALIQWIYQTFTGNHLRGLTKVQLSNMDKLRKIFKL